MWHNHNYKSLLVRLPPKTHREAVTDWYIRLTKSITWKLMFFMVLLPLSESEDGFKNDYQLPFSNSAGYKKIASMHADHNLSTFSQFFKENLILRKHFNLLNHSYSVFDSSMLLLIYYSLLSTGGRWWVCYMHGSASWEKKSNEMWSQ